MVDTVRPVLARHGLAVVQSATQPHSDEQSRVPAIGVETMLVHSSGEWLSGAVVIPLLGRRLKGGGFSEADAQAAGSAITYGRRYGLAALLALVSDDDDDANTAVRSRRVPIGENRYPDNRGNPDARSN